MKPIFSRGPSLQLRLIIAVIIAISLLIADNRIGAFSKVRQYLDTAVSPFYFLQMGLVVSLINSLKPLQLANVYNLKIKR